jgi:hypothetical protein
MSGLSFTNCLLHLEGKEVFGSFKRLADFHPSADNDSHYFDLVNLSYPRVIVPTTEPNIVDDIHMQQSPSSSSKLLPLEFRSGLELKENNCGVLNIAHPIL